jgi:hypothetical protein
VPTGALATAASTTKSPLELATSPHERSTFPEGDSLSPHTIVLPLFIIILHGRQVLVARWAIIWVKVFHSPLTSSAVGDGVALIWKTMLADPFDRQTAGICLSTYLQNPQGCPDKSRHHRSRLATAGALVDRQNTYQDLSPGRPEYMPIHPKAER